MMDKWIIILGSCFLYLALLYYQVRLPKYNASNIILGVKVPQEKVEDEELDKIYTDYKRALIIVGGFLSIAISIVISILFFRYKKNYIFVGYVVYLFTLFLVYLRYNNKVKKLKAKENWHIPVEKTTVVDTKYSSKRQNIRSIFNWARIPSLIILANLLYAIYIYPKLPSYIRDVFSLSNINSHVYKTPIKVFGVIGFQILFLIVGYLEYYSMSRARMDIDPNEVEASINYHKKITKRTNKNLLINMLIVQLIFTYLNLHIFGIVDISTNFIIFIKIIGLIVLLINAYFINQYRMEIALIAIEGNRNSQYFYEDDNLWKIGNTLYFNPRDPAIFIKSRYGYGYTVNAARPLGMILILLSMLIIAFALLIVVNDKILITIINKF